MGIGGERIAKILEETGLSQEALAERIDSTRETVNRWVTGKHEPPYEKVQAAEKVLDQEKKKARGLRSR